MRSVRAVWGGMLDIRPGERLRVLFMALYLLCVLFAYYIIKTASRALFLNQFDIDKLPYLQMLVAVMGGVLAYLYTKVAVQTSLRRAVGWTTGLAAGCLVLFWWLIPGLGESRAHHAFASMMLYVFNVWVSMFSIVMVSQGWLVAANVFNPREAKRVYGLLGLAAVAGAWFGGEFTRMKVQALGTRNLLWASVVLVMLAYAAFRAIIAVKGVDLSGARAAQDASESFCFREIPAAIRRHRHLQVIIWIMLLMFMVDSMLDYQFSAMAKKAYRGDQLTAFLGGFYGRYLNFLSFGLQFFLTVPLVRLVGLGGALQAMPITMAAFSLATFSAPGLWTTALARLSEAGSRYSVNRTGMELLYVPLPAELKNRTKAFVDICIDRAGRGLGGLLLLALTAINFAETREIALATFVLSCVWIGLATVARKEYVHTVRKRLEARRLDFDSLRVNVQDPVTVGLLEQAASSENPRQVVYALSLLAEAPQYDLKPLLGRLARHSSPEVRGKTYELARSIRFEGVLDSALKEVWGSAPGEEGSIRQAVAYILSFSEQATELTHLFLDHPNWVVGEGALEALQREAAADFVTNVWLATAAADENPQRRCLAALAVGVRGDQGTEVLFRLLEDADPRVVRAAFRAAGSVQNRAYLPALVRRLAEPRLRAAAIDALATFDSRICGALGDFMKDPHLPLAARRQIPRVLRRFPDQHSVDVLLGAIGHADLGIRHAAVKALNQVRKEAPDLDYGAPAVTRQILEEARCYFRLHAALRPFRERCRPGTPSGLLARSIDERLRNTLERLFRLLGLRYPARQIYATYIAVTRRQTEEFAAALEFLDNLLDRELKKVLIPLLDDSGADDGAREMFGVEPPSAEAAIRELIRSSDPWLKACAIAAAAELKLGGLREEISAEAERAGADVIEVARAAVAALALR